MQGWIISAFNNIACSDKVAEDLFDSGFVKNTCDLLRSGKLCGNEYVVYERENFNLISLMFISISYCHLDQINHKIFT